MSSSWRRLRTAHGDIHCERAGTARMGALLADRLCSRVFGLRFGASDAMPTRLHNCRNSYAICKVNVSATTEIILWNVGFSNRLEYRQISASEKIID
jgi:hypothetical protein